jgi:hypothetical protein
MTLIDYSSGSAVSNVGGHTVYAKSAWADGWVEQPNMTCVECRWAAAPEFGSAVIEWEMGEVILPGDVLPTTFGVFAGRGQFVRIDWLCDDNTTLRWVGYIDQSSWPTEAFGVQTLVCYGLERALALTPITGSVWRDEALFVAPTARRTEMPVDFNGPEGLRSAEPLTAGESDYLFAAADDLFPEKWSTRDIVSYLMRWHLPTSDQGVADIPWVVQQLEQLPDWDSPLVETRNRTLWDVLRQLIDPTQQLGFTVGSDGSTAYLRCFTHLASEIEIGGRTLAANPRQHTLTLTPDALTDAKFSDLGGQYDQVICRGARRKSICTLVRESSHFEPDWTDSQKTEYDEGASNDGDYAGLSDDEKDERNQVVRNQVHLGGVYRDYRLRWDFDWTISGNEIFPGNTQARFVRALDRVPIGAEVDWSGAVDEDWFVRLGDDREDQPAVARFTGWSIGLSGHQDANAHWKELADQWGEGYEYRLLLVAAGALIQMVVEGAPQHFIALNLFDSLPIDDKLHSIQFKLDPDTLKITLALEEDRFVEGRYPAVPPSADVVRRLLIDAGEAYQQVYIVPGTITGVDADGNAERSDGGYLVDDTEDLEALAELYARGTLASRKSVQWQSARRISEIAVGDLITTADGADVYAPVTMVQITAPTGTNRPGSLPTQQFSVYRGEVDLVDLMGRLRP